jgi:hypothetical protein
MMSKKHKKYTLADIDDLLQKGELSIIVAWLEIEMKPLMVKSGAREKAYDLYFKKLNKNLSKETVEWLCEFYKTAFVQTRRAYNNLPEHAWENYKILFAEFSAPEQILLFGRQKQLRQQWRRRPTITKKEEI